MSRLKPYFRLVASEETRGDTPCPRCGSHERIQDTWVEGGHGWLPDDYEYVVRCECGEVEER